MSPIPVGGESPLDPCPDTAQRWALFLDVDGTLIDIASHPEQVTVPAALRQTLGGLLVHLQGAVALVSGRRIEALDRLFAPMRLPAAGVHGCQLRLRPHGAIETTDAVDSLRTIREVLAEAARCHAGCWLEDKEHSLAVHYRQKPGAAASIRQIVQGVAARHTDSLAVLPGKMVLEVKPKGISKHSAVLAFMARPPFVGRRPVFVGDDVTDLDGFAAVRSLGGHAIQVGFQPDGDTPWALPNAGAVRAWLARVAGGLATIADPDTTFPTGGDS